MNIRHSVMTNEFKHNKYSTFSETLNEQNNCANKLYVDKSNDINPCKVWILTSTIAIRGSRAVRLAAVFPFPV